MQPGQVLYAGGTIAEGRGLFLPPLRGFRFAPPPANFGQSLRDNIGPSYCFEPVAFSIFARLAWRTSVGVLLVTRLNMWQK